MTPPQRHGLMPLVLQRYTDAEQRLLPEGMNIRMVAARECIRKTGGRRRQPRHAAGGD